MKNTFFNQHSATYQNLLNSISATYVGGQQNAVKLARREMLITYWHIGQHIVEFEQKGKTKQLMVSSLSNNFPKICLTNWEKDLVVVI